MYFNNLQAPFIGDKVSKTQIHDLMRLTIVVPSFNRNLRC